MNLCENVDDVSLEDKIIVEENGIINLLEIFKEEVQPPLDLSIESNSTIEVVKYNKVEEVEIINMVLPIHIEDEKVVLKEDLIEKVKFVGEHIEQFVLGSLYCLGECKQEINEVWILFKVSRKIDVKAYEFELQDALLLYFKFHPPNYLLFLAKLEDELFSKRRLM